ncbi:flagellin lysine-N-methylase [Pseudomonas tremae]|uniref:flagellin lysine-N-methylase n=1 Tax=Pseudomonas syringae group TaxID=136849 RepID=UPI000EFE9360|nr:MULTISPECIES: flagellin lysine-N-methylase [Pseudomonas syringae group]MCF5715437.1 hypothetical protein [Pseudomonas tremae]MCF5746696.1 hypothetical protein [Pseudomonas tremae]MCQ2990320.1 flagellin lysine-N-methylase [Pseudomonas tremae]RMN23487.1 hypothetical protein ALQ62_03304 [Pseudomonas coronafaciens pv. zizaniae]RMP32863.1 hypothetical protein ALQ25_02511 [Pseudomonas coronafaciens pv. atropurpurea]
MASSSAIAFHYAQSFSCIAEKCEDNCCQEGWQISVSDQRVDAYKRSSPELLNLIASDNEGFRMNLNADNQCMALQGGRCSVHTQYGEAALPDICATYPRMNRRFDAFIVKSATMSCPEVARLVLFGDTPFLLEDSAGPNTKGDGSLANHLIKVDPDSWASIILFFSEQALTPHRSVYQIIGQLCYVVSGLEGLPYEKWMESIHRRGSTTSPLMLNQEPEVTDQLLQVLEDILKARTIPESMRKAVSDAITVQKKGPQKRQLRALKPEFSDTAQHHADAALEQAIKRFIAAEITRTGFPFISTTPAGQDYGLSLSEWTATLAIRTLALRLLLLAHCDQEPDNQLPPQKIVELIYRYCRAANHNLATASEIALRRNISARILAIHDTSVT